MSAAEQLVAGRYRVGALLGQGGMADVYRATDTVTGTEVAVKLVRSADPDLARRLALEAKALARLEHPGLVRLLDAGVHGQQAFLVMELVDGPTLSARLRRGALSPERTAVLGRTLAGALAFVHTQGIVHRDVKPANVLLGPGPRARLADFGIARLADAASLTVTGTTLGTAGYMAPEQLEHHAVGPAADVWSLGIILLECLTGERLFEGTPTEVVARRLAGPVPLPHDLPATWRLLFEGMLDPDPDHRPDATQVAGLLSAAPFSEPWVREPPDTRTLAPPTLLVATPGDGARATEGPGTLVAPAMAPPAPGPPTGAPPPRAAPDRGRTRRRWMWAIGALAVLVAAGLTALALSSGNPPKRTVNGTHSTTTTVAPTTTSSTTTTAPATTTTALTAPSAANTLESDLNTGVSNGTVSSNTASKIENDVTQALSASSEGNQDQVAQAINDMKQTIANDVGDGAMPPSEGSTLLHDVSALAQVLGVTSTTTSTGPTGPTGNSGPGNGRGGGR
ncbi:MAG TPA: serine/threonine-protein kinase [Acidimicrobiales bacterium]|nr:serine/threonine-protein kinase [Acidimicrobiales bacterium]